MKTAIFSMAVLVFLISPVNAFERWNRKLYQSYSQDKKYCFCVVPKENTFCATSYGVLFKRENNKDIAIWSRILENRCQPRKAIVSDTGRYVVTFDDLNRRGYGDNVLIIYGRNGEVLHKFPLEEILSETELLKIDTRLFYRKRIWEKENPSDGHWIDEKKDLLTIKTTISTKKIDIKSGKLITQEEKTEKIKTEFKIDWSNVTFEEPYECLYTKGLYYLYRNGISDFFDEKERRDIEGIVFIGSEKLFIQFCKELEGIKGIKYEYRVIDKAYKYTRQFKVDSLASSSIQEIIDALRNRDRRVRAYAAQLLGAMGNKALPAMPYLVGNLKDWDRYVRESAAAALSQVGTEAIPQLLIALNDKNDFTRYNAAQALGNMGQQAASSTHTLLGLLGDSNKMVRISAIEALGKINSTPFLAVPALVSVLKESKFSLEQSAIVQSLVQIGEASIPVLISTMIDQNWANRYLAAEVISKIKPIPEYTVSALVTAMKDPDCRVRNYATCAIGNIYKKASFAIPLLIGLFEDPALSVRYSAAKSLSKMGPESIPFLLSALNHDKSCMKTFAALSLGYMGREASIAIPQLIKIIQNEQEDVEVRSSAICTLGEIALIADTVMPTITDVFRKVGRRSSNNERKMFNSAVESLCKIGEKDASALILALNDENSYVRSGVVKSLSSIHHKTDCVVNALISALQDESLFVRRYAIEGLGGMGVKAAFAKTILVKYLKDKDRFIKESAEWALNNIETSERIETVDSLFNGK